MKYNKHKDNPEGNQKDSKLAENVSGIPLEDPTQKSMYTAVKNGWVSSMCYEHADRMYNNKR